MSTYHKIVLLLLLMMPFGCLGQKAVVSPEIKAEFPGGTSELYKFLGKHIHYPEKAIKAGVSFGPVILGLDIGPDGNIKNISILKRQGFGIDEECIRVLKSMPRWKPATVSGKPVRSLYKLPIQVCID